MEVIYLDQDNIDVYKDYFSEDMAENIGRSFHHGFVVTDGDDPAAGIIWEIRNVMKEGDRESHIVFIKIDNDEASDILFDTYKEAIAEDEAVKSTFSLPAKASVKEKDALKNAGFTVDLMEGDTIRATLSEISEIGFIKKVTPSAAVKPLSNLNQRALNFGIRHFTALGQYGLCEDIAYLSRSYFENDVSCYLEGDEQINGLLLYHKIPSGALKVILMAVDGNAFVRELPGLMSQSVSRAMEIYDPGTEVWIDRHNYSALALTEKLFPSTFGIPVYVGSRDEI
ncbi:MAG: hypothetical protein IJU77_11980 [Butyrivibrio sp.]|nr:hypothetical protein [Butyrivibrio sp.]